MRQSSSFSDWFYAQRVLTAWRRYGQYSAQKILSSVPDEIANCSLVSELILRLCSASAPRVLVDGLWLSRPHGGITRVWQQIFNTWLLPGFISHNSPIAFINRNSHLSVTDLFENLDGVDIDPLDFQHFSDLAEENGCFVRQWGASAFISTWISSTGSSSSVCPELALVHDCMPERFRSRDPDFLSLRYRWLHGASSHLGVSFSTARDLHGLLGAKSTFPNWCHLAPAPIFSQTTTDSESFQAWRRISRRASLPDRFILLPATGSLGSYKNPELVASALNSARLSNLSLVLSGIAAGQCSSDLVRNFPHLRGRVYSAGFSDCELSLVYRNALAVVIPSRMEGFGLPAIEVMASGGVPLIADSCGLREAGAEAACRFCPDQPPQLSSLLELLIDPITSPWVRSVLHRRASTRLQRLNPDLIGLALCAIARQISQ